MKQRLDTVMYLPRVWGELLNMEEFSPGVPTKPLDRNTEIADQEPYRDDFREVAFEEGDFRVAAQLCSGSNNYWLQWVIDGPDDFYYESDPEHDLPGEIAEFVTDPEDTGIEEISFAVRIV